MAKKWIDVASKRRKGYAAAASLLAFMITASACGAVQPTADSAVENTFSTEDAAYAETDTNAAPDEEMPVSAEEEPVSGKGYTGETNWPEQADTDEPINFRADGSELELVVRRPKVFDNLFFDNPDYVNGTTETDELYTLGFYKVSKGTAEAYLGEALDIGWMEEHEDYTEVSASEVKSVDVGDKTFRYAVVAYDYRQLTNYIYYSCCEAGGELITVTVDCTVSKGVKDPVGEEGIRDIWENISIRQSNM